ncbi:MAG: DNA-3-methyladenine glycosylase [Sulfitobacter litoralis]|uniref:DNA-3-methyladenine glycosylase II n=2 Tax=Sulfitobacter litoralis TaxID=335975 RepID=A0ABY0SLE3_9RHOB|nr:DNA-3-methyladenine glycosylase [Sulfitobacter litoralis]MBQ0715720.1 DNA-3-methyladenine glycosylase 2 family protein [Sulfitobacter litoralis]SDP39642.1 DNA-3-methyladenine glycosylase II [Sulfitobacter litoralis]
MSTGPIITCDADVVEGAAWLAAHVSQFAIALDATGPLPLRLRADGFDALIGAIISQQVSVASANAMRAKMDAAGLTHEAAIIAAGEEGLRAAGLSRQKIRYALALAEAGIDYTALRDAPDAVVIDTLTAVPGVGLWTAQIYAMFSLGRADILPQGDLALQEAAKILFDLPQRPKPKQLASMAQDWSPWRSVAARILFSYYRVAKQREGIS